MTFEYRSTEDALFNAVDYAPRAANLGPVTSLSVIDLSKAFDNFNHRTLLEKVDWCGIGSDWVASFQRRSKTNGERRIKMVSHM